MGFHVHQKLFKNLAMAPSIIPCTQKAVQTIGGSSVLQSMYTKSCSKNWRWLRPSFHVHKKLFKKLAIAPSFIPCTQQAFQQIGDGSVLHSMYTKNSSKNWRWLRPSFHVNKKLLGKLVKAAPFIP